MITFLLLALISAKGSDVPRSSESYATQDSDDLRSNVVDLFRYGIANGWDPEDVYMTMCGSSLVELNTLYPYGLAYMSSEEASRFADIVTRTSPTDVGRRFVEDPGHYLDTVSINKASSVCNMAYISLHSQEQVSRDLARETFEAWKDDINKHSIWRRIFADLKKTIMWQPIPTLETTPSQKTT